MRTYQFDKKGSEIQELLDQIKNKTIYGNATTEASGLMSAEDKNTLNTLYDNVGENIQQINELNNVAGGLDTRLSAAEETLANIFQLDANNFMGIYASTQALEEVQMTGAGWALVGEDLTELYAYVWNIPEEEWQQYGETTYDYSDYSGLVSQVATIGLNLGKVITQSATGASSSIRARVDINLPAGETIFYSYVSDSTAFPILIRFHYTDNTYESIYNGSTTLKEGSATCSKATDYIDAVCFTNPEVDGHTISLTIKTGVNAAVDDLNGRVTKNESDISTLGLEIGEFFYAESEAVANTNKVIKSLVIYDDYKTVTIQRLARSGTIDNVVFYVWEDGSSTTYANLAVADAVVDGQIYTWTTDLIELVVDMSQYESGMGFGYSANIGTYIKSHCFVGKKKATLIDLADYVPVNSYNLIRDDMTVNPAYLNASYNIVYKSTSTNSTLLDGGVNVTKTTGSITVGYHVCIVKVKEGDIITTNADYTRPVAVYDSTFTLLTSSTSTTITCPENAYYAAFSYKASRLGSEMAVYGTEITRPYEAYNPISGYLGEDNSDYKDRHYCNLGASTSTYAWHKNAVESFGMVFDQYGKGGVSWQMFESSALNYDYQNADGDLVADRIMMNELALLFKNADEDDYYPDVITILCGLNDCYRTWASGTLDDALAVDYSAYTTPELWISDAPLAYRTNSLYNMVLGLKLLTNKFPLASIFLITFQQTTSASFNTESMETFNTYQKQLAEKFAIPVIDMRAESGWSTENDVISTYSSDGIHPNSVGNTQLEKYYKSKIKNVLFFRT